MDFRAAMTQNPRPAQPERGADYAARFPNLDPKLRALIEGAAGSAPFLADAIGKERAWLEHALLEFGPAVAGLTAPLEGAVPEALRARKRRASLLVALADLSGVWTLEQVTHTLTDFADFSLNAALKAAHQRLKAKLPDTLQDFDTSGFVALAMGKMGAYELNYSSDIDLICLYDDRRFASADRADVRSGLIKITRAAMRILSDVTEDGYVFRTDLRLRPDAAVTPVVMSMRAAEQYYEAEGRTWERAAHLKARPVAGDLEAGFAYIERLRPFIWRRHLDFAAIQDTADIQVKIRAHKGLRDTADVAGHDLKLGYGGIRAIEFFAQTRQLIAGGRDPSLRLRGTCEALRQLAATGWIESHVAETLINDYTHLRTWEHRVQMIHDAQTHLVPAQDEAIEQMAGLLGQSPKEVKAEMRAVFERVHQLTEPFLFGSAQPEVTQRPAGGAATPILPGSEEITARWPKYPALRSERASELFEVVEPLVLTALARAADTQAALLAFDRFLSGLPAGVQVFALFKNNPQLIDLLADICATAPALADYLGRNARVLDAVLDGGFFEDWPGLDGLVAKIAPSMEAETSYEAVLDTARRVKKDWHFRIGVHHLRGLIDAHEAARQYADLAEAILSVLWPRVTTEFARKHGEPPGNGACVVALGSFGMRACHARSDLDLILIYDAAGVETSQGDKPLPARAYYARLTQALVTALTAPMAEGRLYEVDMRLRPSGRKGPVATSWQAYQDYQQKEAWTWERLALTRARAVAGPRSFCEAFEAFRGAVIDLAGPDEVLARDVAEMRRRLAAEKWGQDLWDAKDAAGGLQDLDLFAQLAALIAGSPERASEAQVALTEPLVGSGARAQLQEARDLYWRLQALTRLVSGGALVPEELSQGGQDRLLKSTKCVSIEALETEIRLQKSAAAQIIEDGLGQFIATTENEVSNGPD
ncbi:MAG: glutamine-synthetase adenylyltransferase [Pseudomonadota bacterium]